MENFVYHNPTKILFGRDTLASLGDETAAFGSKVLLVYGRGSIKSNKIYNTVCASLAEAGLQIIEYGGVQANPSLEHVRAGITAAKKHRIEVIVAVGGGSVMDSGKAIAAGSRVDHDVWKFFIGKKSITDVLPVICVPTLAASGSEMNAAMVLTNREKQQKYGFANRKLYPKVSILDPTTTFSVSPSYTAYGAVDAISHLLECYFTCRLSHTPIQDRMMEGLVLTLMESCELVLQTPDDYEGRANLMWCAGLALSGVTWAGLGKVGFPMHLIEHSLSALYDVPHGAGLAVVMPGWLRYQAGHDNRKILQFAERVFGLGEDSEGQRTAEVIHCLTAWLVKIGCPVRLADLGIPPSDIPVIADNALALAKIWRLRDYTVEKIEEILLLCR
jgi:hypothetical protein